MDKTTKAFPPTVYPVLIGMGELLHIYKEKICFNYNYKNVQDISE